MYREARNLCLHNNISWDAFREVGLSYTVKFADSGAPEVLYLAVFEVLTAVQLRIPFFSDMILCQGKWIPMFWGVL